MSTQPPRFTTIADGLVAQVIESTVLPVNLMTLLTQLRAVREAPALRPVGTRISCTQGLHDLQPWRQGVWRSRELRLSLCTYCGAVEVRDVSVDLLSGVSTGRNLPRRRDAILGWYSGSRPQGRVFV